MDAFKGTKEQRFLLFLDAVIVFFFIKTIFCCSLISRLCIILLQRDATLSDFILFILVSAGIELDVSKLRPTLFH